MNYQRTSCKRLGTPKLKEGSTTTYVQKCQVVAGVVGDTYGFRKSAQITFEFLDTDLYSAIQTKAEAAADAYITATWPDTV